MFNEHIKKLFSVSEPTISFVYKAPKGISRHQQRLGVFSGSFNPPTVAHLHLCSQAQAILDLHEVLLLLAVVNMDKPIFGLSLEDRLKIMVAIAQEKENWSVAACSHGRFVEKAQAVAKEYPKGTKLWFLVGHDTFVRVFEPRFYKDVDINQALRKLFAKASFAVMPRWDFDEENSSKLLERPNVKPFKDQVTFLSPDLSLRFVSSSQVRELIKLGEPIDNLVPPIVKKMMEEICQIISC